MPGGLTEDVIRHVSRPVKRPWLFPKVNFCQPMVLMQGLLDQYGLVYLATSSSRAAYSQNAYAVSAAAWSLPQRSIHDSPMPPLPLRPLPSTTA